VSRYIVEQRRLHELPSSNSSPNGGVTPCLQSPSTPRNPVHLSPEPFVFTTSAFSYQQRRRTKLAINFSTDQACVSHAPDMLGACAMTTSALLRTKTERWREQYTISRPAGLSQLVSWQVWHSMRMDASEKRRRSLTRQVARAPLGHLDRTKFLGTRFIEKNLTRRILSNLIYSYHYPLNRLKCLNYVRRFTPKQRSSRSNFHSVAPQTPPSSAR
jgi:hypothetical protein